ncbi:B-cell receptor CD22-like isoform X2 [Gambusia affinis]|uniref:B-cell receptor CD22-like isoform X2 n=1 Tax=Gambusia affinis TaxID=33528 RepID=UPI001CDC60EF|nr:B-cell receptor CD22-like isoform X2 [Gambusia affinis]
MKGAAMSFSAVICGVVVLLMAADVCGQNGWGVTYSPSSLSICALKGSTVEMSCNYFYPTMFKQTNIKIKETFWFTKEFVDLKDDTDYSRRVKYNCTNTSCTLKIFNVRQTDSQNYKFRFITNHLEGKYKGSPGVSLSVTVDPQLQVKVNRFNNPIRIQLTCHTDCLLDPPVSYVWLEDEKEHKEKNNNLVLSSFNTIHRYQCAIRRREDVPSPAVYAPQSTVLSVTPSETVEGSTVTLTCSCDAKPEAKYNIYRMNEDQHGQLVSTETQLVFSSIQVSDSGKYYCTAGNDLGSRTSPIIDINVKYGPKNCSVSVKPSGSVEEGKSVTLTCSSDANPAASYTWYKENQIISNGSKDFNILSIGSEHRGSYSCKAQNLYGECNSSPLFLDVLYAPNVSVSITPSGEIMEGNQVTLTCSSDANPAASYTWYRGKDNKLLESNKNLIFNSINVNESGQYYCTAINNRGEKKSSVSVDVKYAPRSPSVSQSPSGHIMVGSSVTLTCSSDANPAASYTWYKEGEETPKASEEQFTITNIQNEHSGKYYCTAQNNIGRQNTSLSVTVVAGQSKLVVIVTIASILLIMIFLLIFLISRKWRTSTPPPKPGGNPNNIEQLQQSQRSLSKSQEDLQYSSVRFLKKQRDPVYENFQPGKTATAHLEEEGENIEYATVKFGQRTENPEPEDDSNALYSVVNKPKPGN